jgi:flagellar motor switch protein FliM
MVSVEGIPKFRGQAGAFKGHKAIRITDVIRNPAEAIGD